MLSPTPTTTTNNNMRSTSTRVLMFILKLQKQANRIREAKATTLYLKRTHIDRYIYLASSQLTRIVDCDRHAQNLWSKRCQYKI